MILMKKIQRDGEDRVKGEQTSIPLCVTCKKIIGASYFNKALKAVYNITVTGSARDCVGHGTQVASIAAGNYLKTGAPISVMQKAQPKVLHRLPSWLFTRLVMVKELLLLILSLAYINQAIADGVDLISISLVSSSSRDSFDELMAISTFFSMKKRIFVSSSAANDGPTLGTMSNEHP